MSRTALPRIAIIGAGPIGLEAAVVAKRLGFPFAVYERGRVGEHVRRWGHIKLFTPFGMNSTPLGLAAIRADAPGHKYPPANDIITGQQYVEAYLDPLAQSAAVIESLHLEMSVLIIGRAGLCKTDGEKREKHPFRLLLRDAKGAEKYAEADIVLDCTGTFGQPRWLGDGGIPALGEVALRPKFAHGVQDVLGAVKNNFASKTVLLVGGGYSAATMAVDLSALSEKHPESWTIWLARGPRSQPLPRHPNDPLKERDRLAAKANQLATRGDSGVEFHHSSAITAVAAAGDGFTVTTKLAGKEKQFAVDRIISCVGYAPDNNLYRELQVHECYASQGPMALAAALLKESGKDCLIIGSQGANALKTTEPGFYVLGAKSYGRNTHFLLKTGFEQVREAFTSITGKPNLDLLPA